MCVISRFRIVTKLLATTIDNDNKPVIALILEVLFELLFLYKVHFLITKI